MVSELENTQRAWREKTLAEVEEAARTKPPKEVLAGASALLKRGHMDFPLLQLSLK